MSRARCTMREHVEMYMIGCRERVEVLALSMYRLVGARTHARTHVWHTGARTVPMYGKLRLYMHDASCGACPNGENALADGTYIRCTIHVDNDMLCTAVLWYQLCCRLSAIFSFLCTVQLCTARQSTHRQELSEPDGCRVSRTDRQPRTDRPRRRPTRDRGPPDGVGAKCKLVPGWEKAVRPRCDFLRSALGRYRYPRFVSSRSSVGRLHVTHFSRVDGASSAGVCLDAGTPALAALARTPLRLDDIK
jgi:hypothetical protein